MSKQSGVLYQDNSVDKLFRKVKARVLSDPDVVALLHRRLLYKFKIQLELYKCKSKVITNVGQMKKSKVKPYKYLVEHQINDTRSIIDSYSVNEQSESIFALERPVLLCKCMPKDYAIPNIINHQFKFGSIGEYRVDDRMECTIPILSEERFEDVFDVVQARILKGILEDQHLDIESIWEQHQQ